MAQEEASLTVTSCPARDRGVFINICTLLLLFYKWLEKNVNMLIGIVCNMGDKVCTIMNRVADSWTSSVYKMREEWLRYVNNGEQINPPNLYPVG